MAETPLYRDRNLQVIFGVSLMAVMGVANIVPAFPLIVKELGVSDRQVGLLITVFTMPGVILSLVFGVLADRIGRKTIMIPSLFLFGVGGTACVFARDFNTLLILRLVQGIGGVGLGSIGMVIIGDLYSGSRLIAAMSLNAAVLSVGTAVYPFLGGALATFGWYYPFALSVLAIPVGVLAIIRLKNPEPRNPASLFRYLLDASRYLKDIRLIAMFLVGVMTFILLYGAFLTYFAFLLSDSFDATPFVIGVIISCMSASTAITAMKLSSITERISPEKLIVGSFVVYAVALALIPLMPAVWLQVIPSMIYGVAVGLSMPTVTVMVVRMAPIEHRAAVMSINATMLRVGQTAGPPLIGMFHAFGGIKGAFYASAILALTVPFVAILANRIKKRHNNQETITKPGE